MDDDALDRAAGRIELEAMLLGRYVHLSERQSMNDARIERSAYLLLSRLRTDPLTLSELSQAFELDVSTLNRQTSAMLREGLVERIADPEGGIARRFRITDEGERRLGLARSMKVSGLASLLSDWTPQDRDALALQLRHLNETIEERKGSTWPRPTDDS